MALTGTSWRAGIPLQPYGQSHILSLTAGLGGRASRPTLSSVAQLGLLPNEASFLSQNLGGFLKLSVPFWGPHNRDHNISGLYWGSPYFGKLPLRLQK